MLPQTLEIEIKNGFITDVNQSKKAILWIDGKKFSFGKSCFLPGFVDTHCHFLGLGMKLSSPDLSICRSEEEVVKIIADVKPKRSNWIYGRGWNQENWKNPIFPNKDILQSEFPNDLVFLTRVDGHAAWVNQNVINYSVSKFGNEFLNSTDVIKDENNNPTGIFLDSAMLKVVNLIDDYSKEDYNKFANLAIEACNKAGITEIHDMDVSPEKYKFIQELDLSENFNLRSQIFIGSQNDQWEDSLLLPESNLNTTLIGTIYYSDGAIGSRGAAMIEPYSDDTSNYGLLLIEKEKFINQLKKAAKKGFQLSTHAIGDMANRFVLDAYQELRKDSNFSNTIMRIEHAQTVHPDDLLRFKKLNVNPIVQSIHCTSDAPMAIKRLGERCEYAYPWNSFIKNDITICGSSDFPIESESVLMGLDAFVNRIPFNSNESFYPKEIISISEALDSYCLNPHLIIGKKNRGKIEPNYLADLVILDNNFSDTSQNSILNTRILATVKNGRIWENY